MIPHKDVWDFKIPLWFGLKRSTPYCLKTFFKIDILTSVWDPWKRCVCLSVASCQ